MNSKTTRMIGMGGVAIAMVSWMGYDYFSKQAPPPIISDYPTEIDAEPVDTQVQVEESIPPQPEIIDQQTQVQQAIDTDHSGVVMSEFISSDEMAITADTEAPLSVVTFTLSNHSKKVLNALEETYLSQVTDAKLAAQISATTRQNELDKLQEKEVVTIVPDVKPSLSTIDLLTVKSIVSTPKRITAWVQINDQTVPIQRGAWIDDVRALNITKDFVRFVNKQGKEFTKYVDTTLPTLKEIDDGK